MKDLKSMLIKASKGSDDNWLRSNVGDGYFQKYPQEIIASQVGNQYLHSTTTQLRLAAHRLEIGSGYKPPSYPVVVVGGATLTREKFECNIQDKNLGNFATAQECVDAAISDSSCGGYEVMHSSVYPVWGCRCCAAFHEMKCPVENELYTSHELWDVYQYSNPTKTSTCDVTGLPMSWFLFNVDLMTKPGKKSAPFYENESNGRVSVIKVKFFRDSQGRIVKLNIPSCGRVTVTYDESGIVDTVSKNAISCEIPPTS
eukprot:CAMPEP_0194272048 /NCGR_PEP_ID=MMETSP0169-20130528/5705_1 /TAXON_ID=218684 /ORGANISM="Corethron pennatum, Strain L29A3" /LENGTH=256 /DNA_ID=CAMNT_0039014597 /DNA_START=1141 /DNA_END=1911 /DNA_ORIENTATION=-